MLKYKGFNKNLQCNGFQYDIGKEYIEDKPISLCSRGFHACHKLSQTFSYYSNNSENRFCIVDIQGKMLSSDDKVCTDKIKIVRELSISDISQIISIEESEMMDNEVFCIDIIYELQQKFNFMIGGSASLYLMGYPLIREKGDIDLDIIMPYYQNLQGYKSELIEDIVETDGKRSGNDYNHTLLITSNTGTFAKVDIRIDNKTKYNIVGYKDKEYKVCDLMTILEAKCRYAMECNDKHKEDIISLLHKVVPTDLPKQTCTDLMTTDDLPF